jgi:hypothetical protein
MSNNVVGTFRKDGMLFLYPKNTYEYKPKARRQFGISMGAIERERERETIVTNFVVWILQILQTEISFNAFHSYILKVLKVKSYKLQDKYSTKFVTISRKIREFHLSAYLT